MSNNNFYTPREIRPLYGEIVPTYQAAFADTPWNEVSKCVDEQVRCEGGLSAVAIGGFCNTCGLCPSRPAYEADELTKRFDALAESRPTAWYVEQSELGLTMAAVAWKAPPSVIATEKYADVPEMSQWLVEKLGNNPLMWLDEVFSDRGRKPEGNLQNFKNFVVGLAYMLDCDMAAYRTKEPRMTYVPKRDFGDKAAVLLRITGIPDRRDLVMISNLKEAL